MDNKRRKKRVQWLAKSLKLQFIFLCLLLLLGVIFPAFAISSQANMSRPDEGDGPTQVRIGIVILDVDTIDTAKQSFTGSVYLEARWQDPRLAHGGPYEISKTLNEVWHPRLHCINQRKAFQTLPKIVEIDPNGEVVSRQRVWGTFSQPLEVHDFPLDQQTFSIRLAAVAYAPEEVKLVLDPDRKSGLASGFTIEDWSIRDWQAEGETFSPLPGADVSAGFVLQFKAERHFGYFFLKIILPLVFIVMMSWIVYWIDPKESGTQISVSTTSMLTLIAYRFMVGGMLPKVSYLTRIDVFILLATVLVFATVIEAVITSLLAKSDRMELALAIDRYCRFLIPSTFVFGSLIGFII
jgi:hypothetical protein